MLSIRKHIAVFDFDDVLHDYNKRICETIGINISRIIVFNTRENPLLSDSEKQKMLTAYSDPAFFRDITYCKGIERLRELQDKGMECYINSHCYSNEIKRLKEKSIRENINIPDDHVILTVIKDDGKTTKNITPDTDFFIDDRIDNIINSKTRFNIMPNKPWNTSEFKTKKLNGQTVIRKDNLQQIMNYLMRFVNH